MLVIVFSLAVAFSFNNRLIHFYLLGISSSSSDMDRDCMMAQRHEISLLMFENITKKGKITCYLHV